MLATPGQVIPSVGWMAASFAVANGRAVGNSAPVSQDTPTFAKAAVPGGLNGPVATWVDPFGH